MSEKSVGVKDFSVGQMAYMLVANRQGNYLDESIECAVTKIGRKYITVDYRGWAVQFGKPDYSDTACYLDERTEIGHHRRLFPSKKAAEEYLEWESLCQWVREAVNRNRLDAYSLDQLRAVKRILDDPDYKEEEA